MPLRVATYNVHRCVGRDGRLDVERTLAVLEGLDADLVGLQEVDAHLSDDLGPDLLSCARDLGYHGLHGVTFTREDTEYGNALLSREPLVEIERLEIGVPGFEPRGLLAGSLRCGDLRIRVAVTHLGLRASERRAQAGRILDWLSKPVRGTVLLGDLNEWWPFERGLQGLDGAFGPTVRPASFPSRWPLLALDRVLVSSDIEVLEMRAHRSAAARMASDHLPVVAEVEPV